MKRFGLVLLFIGTYSCNSWAQNIYLEGVSVLGDKKIAYLTIDDEKVAINEGEEIATWKVARIERRAIFLVSPDGKETELQLNTNLKVAEEKAAETIVNVPNVPVIKDEDVPEGYRKIKTPFGDYVILKDYSAPQPTEAPAEIPAIPATEAVESAPDTTVVKTPFGDIQKSVD